MNEHQKNFDKLLKVFIYVLAAWWFLDLLYVLPEPLAANVLKYVLSKLSF